MLVSFTVYIPFEQGDNLCDIIYGCDWHMYDMKSQRLILLLLHDSQQIKQIMLGTFGPMNIVTGVAVSDDI